jgi:hypothetical protein
MHRLALPLLAFVAACQPAAPDPRGVDQDGTLLTVTASGRAHATPDEARSQLGVQSLAGSADEASRGNREKMEKVTATLARLGVKPTDVQTRNLALNRIDYGRDRGRFRADNVVEVRMRDTRRVGEAIAAATDAGANLLSGPDLRISDREKANRSAYAAAYRAARARAEAYAGAAGLRIVRVLAIHDAGESGVPVPYGRVGYESDAVAQAAAPPPPVAMNQSLPFRSFLGDLEQRARAGSVSDAPSLLRAMLAPRRLGEMLVDFALMCASFLTAYALLVDGLGDDVQRAVFLAALPVVLAARYLCFVLVGVYRRVWRFAGARDALAIATACAVSAAAALGIVDATRGLSNFPWQVFALDALLATVLLVGWRLLVTTGLEAREHARSGARRRVLIVGAGRSGRSLARELRETPGERVVGFVDDNPGVRRRRIAGVTVAGGLDEIAAIVAATRPDEVLVTIPGADPGRLAHVADACLEAGVGCRFVERTETEPVLPVHAK